MVACENGIYVDDDDQKSLYKSRKVNDPLHVLESEDKNIYFIHSPGKKRRSHPLALPGLLERFSVCSLDKSDSVYDRLAVRKRNIGVTERDIGTVLIKQTRKQSKKSLTASNPPYCLSFYTDGGILVTSNDADTLTKYKSRSWTHGDGEEEWVLNKLNGAAGICIDDHGQIFVSSNVKKVIYVVSPTGK